MKYAFFPLKISVKLEQFKSSRKKLLHFTKKMFRSTTKEYLTKLLKSLFFIHKMKEFLIFNHLKFFISKLNIICQKQQQMRNNLMKYVEQFKQEKSSE